MNRKIEQRQWDVLYKMTVFATHCKDFTWRSNCDGYDVSLEFPYNNRKIINVITSDGPPGLPAGTQKTLLRNDCYVTDEIWRFLKKGFDEWRKLESKMNNSIAYNYEKAKATLK